MSTNSEYDFRFNWKIKNYSWNFNKVGEYIESPEFIAGKLNFSKWKIRLYPQGYDSRHDEYISLTFIRNNDELKGTFLIDHKVELLTSDGAIVESATYSNKESEPNKTYHVYSFLSKSALDNKLSSLTNDTVTFRYYMKKSKVIDAPTSCEAETGIEVDKCSFKWIIKYPDDENWLEVKNVPFPVLSPFKVRLTSPSDEILINISMPGGKCLPMVNVRCKISLLDINEVEQKSKTGTHTFDFNELNQMWLFPTFIMKSVLKENIYLTDGFFNILFDISSSNGTMSNRIEKYDYKAIYDTKTCKTTPETRNNSMCLRENLSNLFQSKKHADVKLRLNDKLFLVHKLILVVRSPVFSTMFDNDMTESQTGIVDLDDIEENILEIFIKFLYTEELDEMKYEIALKLLIVADKYQVPSLTEKCSSYLKSNFTEINICHIIFVADMVKHETLKSSAVDYIKNHSSKILTSQEWLQWMENNIKLGTEVLTKITIDIEAELRRAYKLVVNPIPRIPFSIE